MPRSDRDHESDGPASTREKSRNSPCADREAHEPRQILPRWYAYGIAGPIALAAMAFWLYVEHDAAGGPFSGVGVIPACGFALSACWYFAGGVRSTSRFDVFLGELLLWGQVFFWGAVVLRFVLS